MKKHYCTFLFVAAAIPLSGQIEVVSGGNVGIGTANPADGVLQIQKAGVDTGIPNELTLLSIAKADNTTGLIFGYRTDQTTAVIAPRTATGNVAFYNYNGAWSETLRLTNTGNVGIGTTNPSNAKLDVVGAGWFQNGATGTADANAIRLLAGASGGVNSIQSNYDTSGAYLPLQLSANPSTYPSQLHLKTDGNVGIGTTSPGEALDVVGAGKFSARVNSNVYNNAANSANIIYRTGTSTIVGNSADALVVQDGGSIGIGTTTPSHTLQVVGSIRATSFISNSTTYADFVFKPGYNLPALNEVEAHIKEHGHLPDIPSEAEAREHGIDLTAMQVKLLQKVEELTLHQIAQEKRLNEQAERIAALETENNLLRIR